MTGTYPVDCHHETVTRRFRGTRKNQFDYGAIPLHHEIHLGERENWGRAKFWDHYGMDPVEIVIDQLVRYISFGTDDQEAAEAALKMVVEDNGLTEEYADNQG